MGRAYPGVPRGHQPFGATSTLHSSPCLKLPPLQRRGGGRAASTRVRQPRQIVAAAAQDAVRAQRRNPRLLPLAAALEQASAHPAPPPHTLPTWSTLGASALSGSSSSPPSLRPPCTALLRACAGWQRAAGGPEKGGRRGGRFEARLHQRPSVSWFRWCVVSIFACQSRVGGVRQGVGRRDTLFLKRKKVLGSIRTRYRLRGANGAVREVSGHRRFQPNKKNHRERITPPKKSAPCGALVARKAGI